jgi:glycosyltransferase involved in cell wall biosynthesis
MSYVTFAILSFEGPDPYSHAGGLGSRVSELSRALAAMGFETHLFFIGDPDLPGYESLEEGRLHLHRWCQWISRHHSAGVYDGEEGKLWDWESSLPAWLESELLAPKVAAGGSVVVMGEEWHTASLMLVLNQVIARRHWQDGVHLFWNANNTFSFDRINWRELKRVATVTTVSRYMKHVMWEFGVDPLVIPNGIPERWLRPLGRRASLNLSVLFGQRLSLVKMARWDPDKRWEMAVDAVGEMKRLELHPLFLARGGLEDHGREVLARAEQQGLAVTSVRWSGPDAESFLEAVRPAVAADMVVLESYVSEAQRRVLFHTADVVLANSGVEPFGLVGLETMAVGGVAFVGSTGEDYVIPGYDAVSLQTSNPREIVHRVAYLHGSKADVRRLRRAARHSAARYTWPAVIRRVLLPVLEEMGLSFDHPPVLPEPMDWTQILGEAGSGAGEDEATPLAENEEPDEVGGVAAAALSS